MRILAIATALVVVTLIAASWAQTPDARRTAIAEMREQRRNDPVAFATARAERRGEREREARPVTVQGPLPLPVAVGGAPLGGSCPKDATCTLRAAAKDQRAVVVTAVWGASAVRCDDVTLAVPPGGAPIAPWWHCERELVVEGAGAGYAGFLAPR